VEVVRPLLRISLDSRDYQEEPVYLSHSSSCQEFRVKVINMIPPCSNSSIKLPMVLASPTISNREVRLQVLKTNHQAMVQLEESSKQKMVRTAKFKKPTDRTNTTST